jgi:ABC-type polysaccharide transport system, permease component
MKKRNKTLILMKRNWILYLFLVPAVVYIAVFMYAPMYGLVIAFKDFSASKGIMGSPWVGTKWFSTFFNAPRFWQILKNTLALSVYSLVVGFPLPVILALIINGIGNTRAKKFTQTVTYMPYFISTVVLVGMMSVLFSPRSGIVNTLLSYLGGSGDTFFMGESKFFRHMYVWSGVWQSTGWNSIIYIAALTGVSQELHEAAKIDGANKLQRILNVDLPAIMPTMVILLIMNCGSILSVGYEKVYLLQNDLNTPVSEVISTYIYKMGLQQQRFSYSTAIGLFNNVINFIILITVNKVSKKISGMGLF